MFIVSNPPSANFHLFSNLLVLHGQIYSIAVYESICGINFQQKDEIEVIKRRLDDNQLC